MASWVDYSPEDDAAACLLVGRFIHHWGFLENALNRSISEFLGSERLISLIVLANIQARDKINALKTLLNTFGPTDDARTKSAAIMSKIGNLNGDRNLIAHTMFWAAKEKGAVEFAVTKAKGRLNLPRTVWRETDFEQRISLMSRAMVEIEPLVKQAVRFQRLHPDPHRRMNALTELGVGSGLGVLAALYHPDPQPQAPQGSPKATPRKAPRKLKVKN